MLVITAYNLNLDRVHTVSAAEASMMASGIRGEPEMPKTISSLEDLFSALIFCMKGGSGAELLIEDKKVADAIERSFTWKSRLGGNAGIMADVLARLSGGAVLSAPALGHEIASLISPGVRIPIDGRLLPPSEAAGPMHAPVHYVLQFHRGEKIDLPGGSFTTGGEDRFIASYDTVNAVMATSPAFDAYVAGHIDEISGALISGFHLVPAHQFQRVFKLRTDQVKGWKEKNPGLYIHAEMGSFQRPEMMEYLLSRLKADSIGMNEAEARLKENPGPLEAVRAAEAIRERFGFRRVCIHTKDFAASAVDGIIFPDDEVEAMAFGSGVAASVMGAGEVRSASPDAGIKPEGRRAVDAFISAGARASGTGAFISRGDLALCIAPSIYVPRPKVTVGLGDTLTAATFFTELQKGVRI